MKKTLSILSTGLAACLLFSGCSVNVVSSVSGEDPGEAVEQTYDVDAAVSRISADEEIGSLVIEKGSEFKVVCTYPEKYMPTVKSEGDQLIISQADLENANVTNSGSWGTYITVPETSAMTNIELEMSLGSITLSDISSDEISVQNDLGNIDMTGCSFSIADIETDAGDIKGENLEIGSGEVSADLGDIELNGNIGDVRVHSDLGAVSVNGQAINEDDD